MFPSFRRDSEGGNCLPHGRGDVSVFDSISNCISRSSPRAWGCFQVSSLGGKVKLVFPTGVGMFLTSLLLYKEWECLPHGRGDVSVTKTAQGGEKQSSPRAWGCFRVRLPVVPWQSVFPTGVGMFPAPFTKLQRPTSLPHGRGDVSYSWASESLSVESSPRAWGCFPVQRDHAGHG